MRLRQNIDLAFGLLIVGAVGWTVLQGSAWLFSDLFGVTLPRGWGPRAGLFPTVVGLPVLVLAIVQVGATLRRQGSPGEGEASGLGVAPEVAVGRRWLSAVGTIAGFAAAVWMFGFLVALPVVTIGYLRFAAHESWRLALGQAVASALLFYVFFIELLRVRLPEGLLLGILFG